MRSGHVHDAVPGREVQAEWHPGVAAGGRELADDVAAASWDSVIFDVGRDSLQRVPMLEPLRGTKSHVDELLARCETAAQLVDEIAGR